LKTEKTFKEVIDSLEKRSDHGMSEIKIARFVGIEACKSIFSVLAGFAL